ncbi:tRNA-2-methylthio-N(6)-dimethylallyladenosine synthase [Buchnera aphidicola (Phyllaphis fagi)]|uniref:tRNA (N6-isopentenyl adenosine(37)-C2)-methylthiotransferase MiaB n=1 Tax=Buchnera aphidicola TaxID=9 RepID=UPI0034641C45
MNQNYKKFYIKTWGCQMNEYDSLMITNILKQNKKYTTTNLFYEADILILNTCSIREKAYEKLFHQLGRWKILKENNPNIIIAVGGCVANQEGKNILKRAKHIDIIFGTQTLHRLPDMINQRIKKKPIIDITFPKLEKFKNILIPKNINYSTSISIMEGCNKYCSFCIVPYTRGREISRPFHDILYEISRLVDQGVKEITLLGQNVNSYYSIDENGKKCRFSKLLQLISHIKKIKRIRFITSNPMDFNDDIINIYYNTPKIVSFLHLPIQSGSNRILKLMKRPYSIRKYKEIINKLILARPNIQISSDFIVGFPGETAHDFQKTMNIISDINFDMSFSFIYSPRPGTPASKLKDNINMTEKKIRLNILQNQIKKQAKKWTSKMLNSHQTILVEKYFNKNKNKFLGKTENNRTVIVKSNNNILGKLIKVYITQIKNNILKGKIIYKYL